MSIPALFDRLSNWLETHWINPAYSGWLIAGLSLFFFGAATNTMAGWLYVISSVMAALLAIAAVLSQRSLRQLHLTRRPIYPVTSGESITVELLIENRTNRPKTLIQVEDELPDRLGSPARTAVELIPAQGIYSWRYEYPTRQRGVYRWDRVQLRTAAPLGLFWCRRNHVVRAIAIVYPTVLPLTHCPLIDAMGRDVNARVQQNYRAQGATEGVTRTLRPYRWGDSTRLIHWRTSARYGELRIRELETFTGGQEIIVCLDSAIAWNEDDFEQAVIAAASLYFYALNGKLQTACWTAGTGIVRTQQQVLEALAAVQHAESAIATPPLDRTLIWLTQQPATLEHLPPGSRWLLWSDLSAELSTIRTASPGLVVRSDQPLQLQLQSSIEL